MSQRRRRQRRSAWVARLLTWSAVSVFLHILLLGVMSPLWPALTARPDPEPSPPMRLVVLELDEEEPEEPDEEDEEIDWDGQLVDVAPPEEEEVPEDAEYLAEHNMVVPEETRSERYRINPEVLAPEYSEEDVVQLEEEAVDVDATEPSSGAQVGNDRFDPDRDGAMAALPSPWLVTNKDGLEAPVPASSAYQTLSGAPNNDLLDEARSNATNLNTKEFLYASYLNQIRRLVNFYWQQNLDNLPGSIRLSKPRYRTGVVVTIGASGMLEDIRIVEESGSEPLDNAVVSAFRIAGPFPPPPEGLVEKDGRAYLPEMGFTVELGQAQNVYQGIDPRSGVQFPGILKAPR